MTENAIWKNVDQYFMEKLIPQDNELADVLIANKTAGLPAIDVSPAQGKFLYLLTKLKGAQNVLEIGTLGGYSAIWFAKALPEDGKVYTLEAEPSHAEIAEKNISHAGYGHKVEVIVGSALDTLPSLQEVAPFDVIFIDADKPNNPHYLKWALALSKTDTVIIADNVVRNGEVTNQTSKDASVQGVRAFMDILEQEKRIEATAVQTVGTKGYDGFVIGIMSK